MDGRPFLFFAVPLFALSLMAVPFMLDIYHFLMTVPWVAALLGLIPGMSAPQTGEVLCLGTGCFINMLFNMVVLSLFSYYYWDVVPGSVLGRFESVGRIVTAAAMIVWNACIFGRSETHPKEVYIGVSLFCLAIYLVSIWRVKEGQYAPPEQRAHKGPVEPVLAYFKDCFSQPYYLWIFLGTLVLQTGNKANEYMTYYYRNDLHLNRQDVGWIKQHRPDRQHHFRGAPGLLDWVDDRPLKAPAPDPDHPVRAGAGAGHGLFRGQGPDLGHDYLHAQRRGDRVLFKRGHGRRDRADVPHGKTGAVLFRPVVLLANDRDRFGPAHRSVLRLDPVQPRQLYVDGGVPCPGQPGVYQGIFQLET